MSFAGHVLDMIKRVEANRRLMRSSQARYGKSQPYRSTDSKIVFNRKAIAEISMVERKAISERIEEEIVRKNRRKSSFALLVTAFIFFLIVVLITF